MFALVITAFRPDEKGQKQTVAFESAVTNALKACGEKVSIQCRKYDDLDSYLFLPDEGFRQDYSAKQFDKVDMVFIDGDDNFLPWDPKLDQVRVLLKMCVLTNKCLFACTFATHMLVYIYSTGAPRLQLADRMLEGCTIREIKTKHVDDPLGMHGSHFIDQHSGDLYQFDIDMDPKGVWSPFMNVGMTLRRAMGKKNKEILRPDPVNADWYNRNTEMPIRVFSKYIQHWLFIGISKQQFIVSWKNKWDIVPPIVAPVNGAFTVLADNPRAPQIFERGNTIGVEFHMMELYPDTILTLNNFVKYQNTRMQTAGLLHSSAYGLRAELGILIRNNKIAYTAQFYTTRFMRGTQKSAPPVSETHGHAQPIQLPIHADASLARRAAQASMALAVRPADTVRPFSQPFGATRANGASLLSPTVRSASAAGLFNATMAKTAGKTASKSTNQDEYGADVPFQSTRFSLPGSQTAPQYGRSDSPTFANSFKRSASPFGNSLNSFATLSASAAEVAASLIPASHYFADDPAAAIDWSSWENHLPASGLPSLGATKPEIRKFLHPDRDDNAPPPQNDEDPAAAAAEAIARAKRAEVVAKWPAGLETQPAHFLKSTLQKPPKPFNAFHKHAEHARTVQLQQLDTQFHLTRGATMTAEANRIRDQAIQAQKERAFTAQAVRRTRYMLDGQVDKVTGADKSSLMNSLGLTLPFSVSPTNQSNKTIVRPATVAVVSGTGATESLNTARSDVMGTPRFPGDEAWLSAAKKKALMK